MKFNFIWLSAFLATSLTAGSGQICRHPQICESISNGNTELIKCSNIENTKASFNSVAECEIATGSFELLADDCYCIVWYVP